MVYLTTLPIAQTLPCFVLVFSSVYFSYLFLLARLLVCVKYNLGNLITTNFLPVTAMLSPSVLQNCHQLLHKNS
jgi:hypothetical protein